MLYLLEQVERSLLFFLTFIRLGRHSFKGVYHNIGAGVLTKLASTCSGEISCPPLIARQPNNTRDIASQFVVFEDQGGVLFNVS